MKNKLPQLRNQRGIALISTAGASTALIALTVVGVDVEWNAEVPGPPGGGGFGSGSVVLVN